MADKLMLKKRELTYSEHNLPFHNDGRDHHDVDADSVTPETDAVLTERARTGDQDAFGELVRRNRARAYGMAYYMNRDYYLAEDVVQESLVKAFLYMGKLMDNERFTA